MAKNKEKLKKIFLENASPEEKDIYLLKNKIRELEQKPIPEKIIEKTEVVKEVTIPQTGEEIVVKINELELIEPKQIDFVHIKNFPWHIIKDKQGNDLITWGNSLLTIDEVDGNPSVSQVIGMTFPNGSVTDDGDNTVTLDLLTPTTADSTYLKLDQTTPQILFPSLTMRGNALTDGAVYGAEVLPDTGWVYGTNWGGDFATGFTHTGGSGTLSNPVTAVAGTNYKFSWIITNYTSGSLNINFGGMTVNTGGASGSGVVTATSAGAFSLSIPIFSNFAGTIQVSVKEVSSFASSLLTIQNSSSSDILNLRADSTNLFFGLNSGNRLSVGIYNTSLGSNTLALSVGSYNTAGGASALALNTTGNYNSAYGALALASSTTSSLNTANGYKSQYAVTTGASNTSLGANTLTAITNQSNNTAIGSGTLALATSSDNTVVGSGGAPILTSGSGNTGLGKGVFALLTTGSSNTAIGSGVLSKITTASNISAFGINALLNLTTGTSNTAMGQSAAENLTTGTSSVAIGTQALYGARMGTEQVAIGSRSQFNSITGTKNTSVGSASLENLNPPSTRAIGTYTDYSGTVAGTVNVSTTSPHAFAVGTTPGVKIFGSTSYDGVYTVTYIDTTHFYITHSFVASAIAGYVVLDGEGIDNTAVGWSAGKTSTRGSYNTFIGDSAGFNASQSVTASNSTAIGYGAYTTASNQVVIGNTSVTQTLLNGNVGIGTTDLDGTPAIGRLTIKGSTNDGSTNILVGRDSDEANVFSVDTNGMITGSALAVTGTGGTGYITLVSQASNPSAPVAGTLLLHSSTVNGFTRMEQDNEATTNLVIGRDNVFIGKNTSGVTISKGQAVYTTGSTGNVPNIAKAKADSATTMPATGIAMDDILDNAFGQIMILGVLANFDTSAFSTGDQLYLSPTTAGELTATRPSGTTNFVQLLGRVLVDGIGNGSLQVTIAPFIGNSETGTNAATWTGTNITLGGSLGLTGTRVVKGWFTDIESTNMPTVGGTSLSSTFEALANKATGFGTLNDTLYPTTQAVATYVAAQVVGLLDYRGSYDASTNLFPATGGSGILGAILKGDFYIVSVAGTLGGTAVTAGDLIIALVDTPAQTASNWDLISNELGYTPANNVLSNLGTVAINTSLVSDTDSTDSIGSTGVRWLKGWFDDMETTNMPTVGGTAILTSLTAPQFTTIELGHASDTTLARVSAGVISVEGVTIPTISSTSTLTNKRINPRLVTAASYTTDTGTSLDVSTCDQFEITAQAGALLFNAPGGTPVGGNKLIIRIKDDGTARALTYNAVFRAMGVALPSTTVLSKTLYMGFIYNATDTKWDLVASAQEA